MRMELHIAAPYLRIPEHLLDLLQKKETVPYFFNGTCNKSSKCSGMRKYGAAICNSIQVISSISFGLDIFFNGTIVHQSS
jgi:hypothetical protein